MLTSGLVTERQQLAYLLRGTTPAEESSQRHQHNATRSKSARRSRGKASARDAAAAAADDDDDDAAGDAGRHGLPLARRGTSGQGGGGAAGGGRKTGDSPAGAFDDDDDDAAPTKKAYERFENGTTYLGWWRQDAEQVFSDSGDSWLSDGFGVQHTAECDGGWVYAGLYSENDRHGFGEIRYTRQKKNSLWSEERGGRIVGFWNADKLHGPVWRFYPKGSKHYRGHKDSGGGHITFAWFLRGMLLKESEYFVYDEQPEKHRIVLNYLRTMAAVTNDITLKNFDEQEARFHSLAGALSTAMLHLANGFNRVAVSDVELANRLRTFSEKSKMWFSRNLSEDDGRGLDELDKLAQLPPPGSASPTSAGSSAATSPTDHHHHHHHHHHHRGGGGGGDSAFFGLGGGTGFGAGATFAGVPAPGAVKFFDEYGLPTVGTPGSSHHHRHHHNSGGAAGAGDETTPVVPLLRRRSAAGAADAGAALATPGGKSSRAPAGTGRKAGALGQAGAHGRSRSVRKTGNDSDDDGGKAGGSGTGIRKKLLLHSAKKSKRQQQQQADADRDSGTPRAGRPHKKKAPAPADTDAGDDDAPPRRRRRSSSSTASASGEPSTPRTKDAAVATSSSSSSEKRSLRQKERRHAADAAATATPLDGELGTPGTKASRRSPQGRKATEAVAAAAAEMHAASSASSSAAVDPAATVAATTTLARARDRKKRGKTSKKRGQAAAEVLGLKKKSAAPRPLSPAERRAQVLARADAMETAAAATAAAADAAAEGLRKIAERDAAVARAMRLQAQWDAATADTVLGLGPGGVALAAHRSGGAAAGGGDSGGGSGGNGGGGGGGAGTWAAGRPISRPAPVPSHCDRDLDEAALRRQRQRAQLRRLEQQQLARERELAAAATPDDAALLEDMQRRHLLERDALVRQYVNARTRYLPAEAHVAEAQYSATHHATAVAAAAAAAPAPAEQEQLLLLPQPKAFTFSDACHTLATGLGFHNDARLAAMAASQQRHNLGAGRGVSGHHGDGSGAGGGSSSGSHVYHTSDHVVAPRRAYNQYSDLMGDLLVRQRMQSDAMQARLALRRPAPLPIHQTNIVHHHHYHATPASTAVAASGVGKAQQTSGAVAGTSAAPF